MTALGVDAAAAVAATSLLVIAMDWLPTPLNRNIAEFTPRDRMPSTLVHGLLGALLSVAVLLQPPWGAPLAAGWY